MPRRKSKNQPQAGMILLIAGGITLLLAALIWANTRTPADPALTAEQVNATEAAIPRVTISEAKTAQEAGEAIILDVRSKEAYAANHVAGALSMPVTELEERLKELDPQKWIIPYCTWPAEQTSARAARILLNNGFSKVTPLLGGFEAWLQAGYPAEP